MKTLFSAVLALVLALGGTAHAQILDKIKDAGKKAIDEQIDMQADDLTRSRPPAVQDPNRKYPPGVSYASVLTGVQTLAKNGKFRMDKVQATFLPPEHKEGFSVLRTADGDELYQFDWQIQLLKKPYSLLSVNKILNLKTGETSSASSVTLASPGDYVLDFYLPTEHFYTLPFAVSKIGSDDPFGDGQCYRLDGDWQNWGYLYYRDAKPDQNVEWKVWLRNEACENRTVKVGVVITRDEDNAIVCTSREFTSHNLHPKWERIAFGMVFPRDAEVPHGTYFKARDLLATDGAHTLSMTLDDQPYGTWKFAVEGGKLTYTGRTVRGVADTLTFIDGGRDAWWYARVE